MSHSSGASQALSCLRRSLDAILNAVIDFMGPFLGVYIPHAMRRVAHNCPTCAATDATAYRSYIPKLRDIELVVVGCRYRQVHSSAQVARSARLCSRTRTW